MFHRVVGLGWPFLAACAVQTEVPFDPEVEAHRASMALRGLPATTIERHKAHETGGLDALIEEWSQSDAFVETAMDLHAEWLQLRTDTQTPLPAVGALEGFSRSAIRHSMDESVLVGIGAVVGEGRPYTDVITTDEVWTDAIGSVVWGLPHEANGSEWQRTTWPDGRSAAGVLSDSRLWNRHISSDSNHNRARANVVFDLFLCADLASRTLDLEGLDLAELDEVNDAVREQASCAGCHDTLDPVASAFFGFHRYITPSEIIDATASGCLDSDSCYPLRLYRPEDAHRWTSLGMPPPGFDGQSIETLHDLGAAVASDPRFARCVARRTAAGLGQETPEQVPEEEVTRLAGVFVDSDWDYRVLAAEVVRSPRFAAQGGDVGALFSRPEQVARTIESLTGFVWWGNPDAEGCESGCWGRTDLGRNARWGVRELAGGTDGYDSLQPVHSPQPLRALATQELAWQAADHVVRADLEQVSSERRLLSLVEGTPEDVRRLKAQVAVLNERILGEALPPGAPELVGLESLWMDSFEAQGDATRAWIVVVASLLQSPELGVY